MWKVLVSPFTPHSAVSSLMRPRGVSTLASPSRLRAMEFSLLENVPLSRRTRTSPFSGAKNRVGFTNMSWAAASVTDAKSNPTATAAGAMRRTRDEDGAGAGDDGDTGIDEFLQAKERVRPRVSRDGNRAKR